MVRIGLGVRRELKRPLGKLQKDFRGIRTLNHAHRLISVGDVCTLGLLAMGIRPHLAVFDHLFMRKKLDLGRLKILQLHFQRPKKYKNPPGTVSDAILKDAGHLISKGGAVLIDGEEDLTALAFIRSAAENDIIIYGQPNKGIVIVRPEKRIKRKVERWLSASAALAHKVERDVRKKG